MHRQKAAFAVMRVEQRKLLCAMHDVDGVVDVQRDFARWARVAGAIDVDQGVAHRRYLAPVGRVLPARHGGLRAQIRAAVRKSAAGQFEAGIKAQPVEIVAVLVAARDRQDAGAQDVGHAVLHKVRIARVGDQAGKRVGDAQTALGGGDQQDTPSDVMRPPSKAATTFLRATAGKWNGSKLSGTWRVLLWRLRGPDGFDTQFSKRNQCLMRHPPENLSHAVNKTG
jgi:hypothetical protein